MSELVIAQGIQDTIRGLADFADADVVLNDWRILDGEVSGSPYVNIETAGAFDDTMDTMSGNTNWEIPAELFVQMTEWKTAMDNLRAYRQAILDVFDAVGTARSAGGLEAVDIYRIRSEGGIRPYIDKNTRPEDIPYAVPIFISQRMIFSVREGWG